MNRFAELTGHHRYAAARQLRKWGYWREVEDDEIEGSVWLRWGPGVIVWIQHEDSDQGAVHMCATEQGQRLGRPVARRFLIGLEVIAELLGITRLWIIVPEQMPHVGEFARRLGWTPSDRAEGCAYYRELT